MESNGISARLILERLCHDMMVDDEEWEESAKPVLKFVENPLLFVEDPRYRREDSRYRRPGKN